MKSIIALVLLMVLVGCDVAQPARPDPVLRNKIFLQCLGAVPKGPKSTVYNDWAEVVSECESAAYFQSLR